jgi:hypothetical protein
MVCTLSVCNGQLSVGFFKATNSCGSGRGQHHGSCLMFKHTIQQSHDMAGPNVHR